MQWTNIEDSKPFVQHVIFISNILLFHSVGLCLCSRCEAKRHLRAFEQINSAPILHVDCPTCGYIYCYLLMI